MHNLYTKFVKILEICKQFSNKFVNETEEANGVRWDVQVSSPKHLISDSVRHKTHIISVTNSTLSVD